MQLFNMLTGSSQSIVQRYSCKDFLPMRQVCELEELFLLCVRQSDKLPLMMQLRRLMHTFSPLPCSFPASSHSRASASGSPSPWPARASNTGPFWPRCGQRCGRPQPLRARPRGPSWPRSGPFWPRCCPFCSSCSWRARRIA